MRSGKWGLWQRWRPSAPLREGSLHSVPPDLFRFWNLALCFQIWLFNKYSNAIPFISNCPFKKMSAGIVRKFEIVHTAIFKMDNQQGPIVIIWNSAQCNTADWMEKEFGGEWIHVYIWLSLFTVHQKLSQHYLLISYTPIQNKLFFKKWVQGPWSNG